jgi:chromosome partitioning protein
MKVLTLLGQKGGAGKSTLATQLAVLAVQEGDVVSLIDTDPQASAVLWRKLRTTKLPIVVQAMHDKLPDMVEHARGAGVDTVVIDTPPHIDKETLQAIRLADVILCPTKPELFNLGAIADTIKLLGLAQAKDRALAVINDLPSGKGRETAREHAAQALSKFEIDVAEQTISHSQTIIDAIAAGLGVTEKSPKNQSAKEIKALWAEITKKWGGATETAE